MFEFIHNERRLTEARWQQLLRRHREGMALSEMYIALDLLISEVDELRSTQVTDAAPNDALVDAARRLIAGGLTSWDDLGTHCVACGETEEWAGDHYAINHTPDCAVVALTAALTAAAQTEKTK